MMSRLEIYELMNMTRLVQNIIETNSSANALNNAPALQVLSLHQLSGDKLVSHEQDIKEMLKSLQFSQIKLTAFSVMDNPGWAEVQKEIDWGYEEIDGPPQVHQTTIEEILERIICKQDQLTFFKHFKEKERKRWW